jgi:hypothetical protein
VPVLLFVCCCSGNYVGPEPERLATLKLAAIKGAPFVDVEFKAAALFFAGEMPVSSTKWNVACPKSCMYDQGCLGQRAR